MAQPGQFAAPARWSLRWLVACHAAAGLLLASWIWPPTDRLWEAIDEAAFFALNGSLAEGDFWRLNWAFANVRLFDKLSGLVMIALLLHYALRGDRRQMAERLAECLVIGLLLLVVMQTSRKLLFVGFERLSPSLVLEPFYDLRELVPGLKPKVASETSFPGDHATVTMMFAIMVWRCARWRYGLAAGALGLLFTLPRLIAGAHWLTDALIGGAVIALVTTSWLLATPVFALACRAMHRPIAWAAQALPALPRKASRRGV